MQRGRGGDFNHKIYLAVKFTWDECVNLNTFVAELLLTLLKRKVIKKRLPSEMLRFYPESCAPEEPFSEDRVLQRLLKARVFKDPCPQVFKFLSMYFLCRCLS